MSASDCAVLDCVLGTAQKPELVQGPKGKQKADIETSAGALS
jgi:hypothetical protein